VLLSNKDVSVVLRCIIERTRKIISAGVNSYKANYRQHSVDAGNYIWKKYNIKSKSNYRQALREKYINLEK
jgi:hypothetical protein